MARKFKYLPSVHKGYAEQGMIFFACQNYAGGEYADALRAYLCTPASWEAVTTEYFVSPSTLDRVRRRFFELW